MSLDLSSGLDASLTILVGLNTWSKDKISVIFQSVCICGSTYPAWQPLVL
jgi:hypothetical protein